MLKQFAAVAVMGLAMCVANSSSAYSMAEGKVAIKVTVKDPAGNPIGKIKVKLTQSPVKSMGGGGPAEGVGPGGAVKATFRGGKAIETKETDKEGKVTFSVAAPARYSVSVSEGKLVGQMPAPVEAGKDLELTLQLRSVE